MILELRSHSNGKWSIKMWRTCGPRDGTMFKRGWSIGLVLALALTIVTTPVIRQIMIAKLSAIWRSVVTNEVLVRTSMSDLSSVRYA